MQNATLDLIQRDQDYLWHPCSQMKDYEQFSPLEIVGAKGSYLHLKNGYRVIDAISSWWCKHVGHGERRLQDALLRQLNQFEHVILVNTTNETIVNLSQQLASLTQTLRKVMYASEGSSAVEMALKMSLHSRIIQGDDQRKLVISLENSYHGETVGALSVSDLGLYAKPYKSFLFKTVFITGLPYVHQQAEMNWHNCETAWEHIEKQLAAYKSVATAIIVEPILQGAGGMLIYSKDLLKRLRRFCDQNNIHLIADEIMTGLGRTGKMLACQHAEIEPDFLCLGKGLTGGFLPMSAMLTTDAIYDIFYNDYSTGHSFLHSHTFSGNVLAASVATEFLTLLEEERLCESAEKLGKAMQSAMQSIADVTGKIKNVRMIGAMVAADIKCAPHARMGYAVYQRATALGAFLRPLGNTIYWLPPLNMSMTTLEELKMITQKALSETAFTVVE